MKINEQLLIKPFLNKSNAQVRQLILYLYAIIHIENEQKTKSIGSHCHLW